MRFEVTVSLDRLVDFSTKQNLPEWYKRLAFYADKILKGTKPGDLPVEHPTRFEFIINSKTAASLKIQISPEPMLRADEVIQ